jgi:hypothetical protein
VVLAPDAAVDAPTTAVPVPGPDRVKAESGLLWLRRDGGLSLADAFNDVPRRRSLIANTRFPKRAPPLRPK